MLKLTFKSDQWKKSNTDSCDLWPDYMTSLLCSRIISCIKSVSCLWGWLQREETDDGNQPRALSYIALWKHLGEVVVNVEPLRVFTVRHMSALWGGGVFAIKVNKRLCDLVTAPQRIRSLYNQSIKCEEFLCISLRLCVPVFVSASISGPLLSALYQ